MRATLPLLCAIALGVTAPIALAAGPPGVPLSPRPPDTPPEQRDPALDALRQPVGQDVVQPRFTRMPSEADINRHYPGAAIRTFTPGDVTLDCRIAASGRLDHCFVLSEAPPGEGFGPAALRLARFYAVRTTLRDGRSAVGHRVRVPVRFRAEPGGEGEDTPR